jgi:hypothetical protein
MLGGEKDKLSILSQSNRSPCGSTPDSSIFKSLGFWVGLDFAILDKADTASKSKSILAPIHTFSKSSVEDRYFAEPIHGDGRPSIAGRDLSSIDDDIGDRSSSARVEEGSGDGDIGVLLLYHSPD